MIIKKCSGRQVWYCLASVIVCAIFTNTAYAWQQEYIADAVSGHTTERYTWDSDHQPSPLPVTPAAPFEESSSTTSRVT